MQEKQREEKIKRWFDMWLTGERQELSRLFDKNVYYSESWGPEYHGIAQLEHWFDDWTQQGKTGIFYSRGDALIALPDSLIRHADNRKSDAIVHCRLNRHRKGIDAVDCSRISRRTPARRCSPPAPARCSPSRTTI